MFYWYSIWLDIYYKRESYEKIISLPIIPVTYQLFHN